MQKRTPQRSRTEAQQIKGYVVHWRVAGEDASIIHFHPEFLSFEVAKELGRSLSVAGLSASVTPVVCRDVKKLIGSQPPINLWIQ